MSEIQTIKSAVETSIASVKAKPTRPEPVCTVPMATVRMLTDDLGERYNRERTSIDKYIVYHRDQAEAVAKVKAFMAEGAKNLAEGRGIILYGLVGTGKDHLLAAAMHHAAGAGVAVRWASGQEIFGRIRDSMDDGTREGTLLKQWAAPAILGISDPIPPSGKVSEWNTMQLYRLLDRRYRCLRPTWVSVNALSVEDAYEKLSAPVFDRLREGAELVPCFWPSYRERDRK